MNILSQNITKNNIISQNIIKNKLIYITIYYKVHHTIDNNLHNCIKKSLKLGILLLFKNEFCNKSLLYFCTFTITINLTKTSRLLVIF